MERRIERKRKFSFIREIKKLHMVWKALAVMLVIGTLAGGIALWMGKDEMPAMASSYRMDQDEKGRYIFRIVEVVPEQTQSILGMFISQKDFWPIPLEKLNELINSNNTEWYDTNGPSDFFYWEGKSNSTGYEPFTVIEKDGKKELVNNEIFKLYMLGCGQYDSNKNIYQNYQDNAEALEEFDKKFVIDYKVVQPEDLDHMELDKINYLHFGSGEQIRNYPRLYALTNVPGGNWSSSYSGHDFSWDTALDLYDRALALENKLSISFSSYTMIGTGYNPAMNTTKLYTMLHFFDDPSLFQELFKGGNRTGKDQTGAEVAYISREDGKIFVAWDREGSLKWDDNWLKEMNLEGTSYVGMQGSWKEEKDGWIPKKYDNILCYGEGSIYKGIYFTTAASISSTHTILNFQDSLPENGGDPPDVTEDGSIKVLEIQPCNRYWLTDRKNLSQLAIAMGEDESDISVTFVTPNTLNGMAVDLTAEYDLIVVGNNIDIFRDGGSYSAKAPYYHIGVYDDAVTLPTYLNGLLKKDYTISDDFLDLIHRDNQDSAFSAGTIIPTGSQSYLWNDGIKEQWGKDSKNYFLKNVELELELHQMGEEEPVSRARFSGNDLTRYMQRQLAEFVRSGQPVITTSDILGLSEARLDILSDYEAESAEEKRTQQADTRMYLALGGIEDEREYFEDKKTPDSKYLDEMTNYTWEKVSQAKSKIVSLRKDWKPEVQVADMNAEQEGDQALLTIMEKGDEDTDLNQLSQSNFLKFQYQIELPAGAKPEDCTMTVIVDRNGDGIFDIKGEGATVKDGKKGRQNNATETILNDQVFPAFQFSSAGSDIYEVKGNEITGVYTAPSAILSLEEFCQFRVVVQMKGEHLRGVWTGYLRPQVRQRDVKILQITPYKEEKGKSLAKNAQFKTAIEQLGTEREYRFDLENGYDTITLYEFEQECLEGTVTAETLEQYDLIIMGTNFSSLAEDGSVDPREQKMAEVLKEYTDVLKRPIIFTSEAMSYVNSANYLSPIKQSYHFRDMTLVEGEALKQLNDPTLFDGINYRKIMLDEAWYNKIAGQNQELLKKPEDLDSIQTGTVYIEPLDTHSVQKGSYRALLYPVKTKLPEGDDRYIEDYDIGWNGLIFNSGTISVAGYYKTLIGKKVSTVFDLMPEDISALLESFGYYTKASSGWFKSYRAKLGYITEDEYVGVVNEATEKNTFVNTAVVRGYFLLKDFYFKVGKEMTLPSDTQVSASKKVPGYVLFNNQYLAKEVVDTFEEKYSYKWQIAVPGTGDDDSDSGKETYTLSPVAAGNHALYPEKNSWNYFLTQTMRSVLGMDRFSVTEKTRRQDKRDYGSTYQHGQVEEIQGYTDGVLLENAYIPTESLPWNLQKQSPYKGIDLGAKPRTTYIEPLNEGVIGLYPYKVMPENETKLSVHESKAPYYQLDLDREIGEGKIDDVTVWYTLSGSGNAQDASFFFETARKDAGNNYYLYSKGKNYYTGFSLTDKSNEGDDIKDLVPDDEMKLFINTIYAALNTGTGEGAETSPLTTLIKEGGNISQTGETVQRGTPNQYICYYDEEDTWLNFRFRIQIANAAEAGATPILIGMKGDLNVETGLPDVSILTEDNYHLLELPEGKTVEEYLSEFPVVKVPEKQETEGGTGSQESDVWYEMELMVGGDKPEGTLIIGPRTPETQNGLRADSIYAEIRLVKRNLFDLD